MHPSVIAVEAERPESATSLEVAMQWNTSYLESVHTFANTINTHEGGTHEEGFRAALTNTANKWGENWGLIKKPEDRLSGDDIREGLTAIISVKLANPQFEGQTKTKLGNTETRSFVQQVVNAKLGDWFEQNPAEGKLIIRKGQAAALARIAARKARDAARDRKGLLGRSGLPGKLSDCQSTNPEECEVFIVEGDSAGGSAKGGRDPRIQAILPIRGKILNVEKARIDRILQNQEVQAIISALGTGIHEDFDIAKLRYHKIVMMADADVDGAHIRTLLLTLMFRFMRPLIEAGHVYLAQPPLFKINWTNAHADELAYTDAERDALLRVGERGGQAAAQGEPDPALQGSRRDEPRPVVGHHHGPRQPGAAAGDAGRRRSRRRDVLDPDGGGRRATACTSSSATPRTCGSLTSEGRGVGGWAAGVLLGATIRPRKLGLPPGPPRPPRKTPAAQPLVGPDPPSAQAKGASTATRALIDARTAMGAQPRRSLAPGPGGGRAQLLILELNMTEVTAGPADRREPVDLQDEIQKSYLDYAMSVIVGRALPDVRDGLKPVHRRILYAMYDGGYRPDRGWNKCARVVGEVMGQYHPHSDSAIYDTLVRLAQPWVMRYPLVASQGNFGSPGQRQGRGHALHRVPDGAAGHGDGPRHHREHRRLQAELRRQGAGAGRAAGPVPEPAGERVHRHRGRHGHQHPHPQSARGRGGRAVGAGASRGHRRGAARGVDGAGERARTSPTGP